MSERHGRDWRWRDFCALWVSHRRPRLTSRAGAPSSFPHPPTTHQTPQPPESYSSAHHLIIFQINRKGITGGSHAPLIGTHTSRKYEIPPISCFLRERCFSFDPPQHQMLTTQDYQARTNEEAAQLQIPRGLIPVPKLRLLYDISGWSPFPAKMVHFAALPACRRQTPAFIARVARGYHCFAARSSGRNYEILHIKE